MKDVIYNDANKMEEKISDLINCELRQNASFGNLSPCCQKCRNSEFVPKDCPIFEND